MEFSLNFTVFLTNRFLISKMTKKIKLDLIHLKFSEIINHFLAASDPQNKINNR